MSISRLELMLGFAIELLVGAMNPVVAITITAAAKL
jgi:hypothetical protein